MSRPSFRQTCIKAVKASNPDTDDEAEYQSIFTITEMMEAEIGSMLEEMANSPKVQGES